MKSLRAILLSLALVAVHAHATITLFGVGTNPADNAANSTAPCVVTPPSSMLAGDLVKLQGAYNGTSTTRDISVSATGGQTWTIIGTAQHGSSGNFAHFWARFNGTWSASPSITSANGSGIAYSCQMIVFRPTSASNTWSIDTTGADNTALFPAPSSPFNVTAPSVTPTAANTVTIATFASLGSSVLPTWTLQTAGWTNPGGAAQWRNTSGADLSVAYKIQTTAAATGSVTNQESAAKSAFAGLVTFAESGTSPTYTSVPALGTVTATTIPVVATLDTTSTEYVAAVTVGSGAPTCSQLAAGTGFLYAANGSLTATVSGTVPLTGVSGGPFDIYACGVTATGGQSLVKSIASAYKLPTFSVAPALGTPGASTLPIIATPDVSGTAYAVAVAAGASTPTAAQVKLGQNAAGTAALNSANVAVTSGVLANLTLTSVVTNPVDIYVMMSSSGGNSATTKIAGAAIATTWTTTPALSSTSTSGYTVGFQASGSGTVYIVAVARGASAPSAAQVVAGQNGAGAAALAAANKSVTSAANTITVSGLSFPIHDLYVVFNNGSSSAVASILSQLKTAPTGKQYKVLSSTASTSFCSQISSPSVAAGDVLAIDSSTSGSFPVTPAADCNFSYPGDASKQIVTYDVYDDSAAGFMAGGPGTLAINDQPPVMDPQLSVVLQSGVAMQSINFNARCTDADDTTLTLTSSDTGTGTGTDNRPAGTSQSVGVWSGTPTTAASGSFTETCTDPFGASDTQEVDWTVLSTSAIPDCTTGNLDIGACIGLYNQANLDWTLTLTCSAIVSAGNIISQVPAAGTSVDPFVTGAMVAAQGTCSPSAAKYRRLRARAGMKVQ